MKENSISIITIITSSFVRQLSYYRSELMGLTMIGVIVAHFITRCDLHSAVLTTFSRIFHVEIFILLSGFGLVYAMGKRPSLVEFFLKRLVRVYCPFLIMTAPFFFYEFFVKDVSLVRLLMQLTALDFWFHGNYLGAWYVSFSILLYFFSPCSIGLSIAKKP